MLSYYDVQTGIGYRVVMILQVYFKLQAEEADAIVILTNKYCQDPGIKNLNVYNLELTKKSRSLVT